MGHPINRTGLQAADEEFALEDYLGGEVIVQGDEELFVVHDLALPCVGIDVLELVEGGAQRGPGLSMPFQCMSSK